MPKSTRPDRSFQSPIVGFPFFTPFVRSGPIQFPPTIIGLASVPWEFLAGSCLLTWRKYRHLSFVLTGDNKKRE